MSSPTRIGVFAALALSCTFGAAVPALADVACPPSKDGHRLAAVDGGDLYDGPIRDNATLAPDTSSAAGGPRWVNAWALRDGAGVTLVCRYAGSRATVQLPLPAGPRACRQDARSFVCR